MHLVRSILRYNQGVFALELLNRPGDRASAAPLHDLIANTLQSIHAEIAAILDDQLESARRAQAVDRRCPERRDDRPRTSR